MKRSTPPSSEVERHVVDPTALLERALAKGLDISCEDVDDRDIKRAPNVLEWLTGQDYLNLRPYAKQIEDALLIFGDACLFCSDTDFLLDMPIEAQIHEIRERVHTLRYGRCKRCGRTKLEMRREWLSDPENSGRWGWRIKADLPNDVCLLEGQRCVVGTTPVLTMKRGVAPMRSLSIGELIWTPRGWEPVEKKYEFKNKRTVRLETDRGTTLRCGLKHRLLVLTDQGKTVWKRVRQIKVGDWIASSSGPGQWSGKRKAPASTYKYLEGSKSDKIRKWMIEHPKGTHLQFMADTEIEVSSATFSIVKNHARKGRETNRGDIPEEISNDLGRLIGYLLSEGSCTSKYVLRFSNEDNSLHEDVRSIVWKEFGLDSATYGNSTEFCSIKVRRWLAAMGLGYDDCYTKRVPRALMSSPPSVIWNLLAGLYEGDGSLSGGKVRYFTSSKHMARDLFTLLRALGFNPLIRCGHSRVYGGSRSTETPFYEVKMTIRSDITRFCSSVPWVSHKRDRYAMELIGKYFGARPHVHYAQKKSQDGYEFERVVWIRNGPRSTLYDITIPGHTYWTNGLVSHNSGKSTKTAMYSTYVLHRFLKLPNPSRWFHLLRNVSALYGTFVSFTATQAEANLWQPFADMVSTSPWFKTYHQFLDERGKELGVELWAARDTYLYYQHKRLGFSFQAADQRSLRGKTRLLSAIDELAWLVSGGSRAAARQTGGGIKLNASGIVRALDRSLSTVRNVAAKKRELPQLKYQDGPDAYMFTISSPSSALDPMMQRVRAAPKSPRRYYIKRETWNSNPEFSEARLRAQEGDINESEFQCVDPTTLVNTNNGLRRIGDLCTKYGVHEVEGVGVNSHQGLFPASHVIRNKPGRTLEVETQHGLRVICTPDQKFLVISSNLGIRWVYAKNLNEGDHVVVANTVEWPQKLPQWSFTPYRAITNQKNTNLPASLTPEMARFLGYHASEGSLSRTNYTLRFSNTDQEVALDYLRLFNILFGVKKRLSKEWGALSTKWSYGVSLTRKDVYEWMHVIGAQGNSYTKQIPWVILQSPREFVVEFLRGLFEGDGSIWRGNASDVITLELASEDLVRQTQIMLLQFNILSAVNPSKGGHRLVISGPNRDRFINTIGFISETKKRFRSSGSTKQHSLTLNIPNTSRNWSAPRISEIKHHRLGELDDTYLSTVDIQIRRRIATLKRYVTSPIRSVVQGPIADTCDFAIPKTKRFLGNGLVLHNCDYGCNPPYSDAPWWESQTELLNMCRNDEKEQRLWIGGEDYVNDEVGGALRWIYYKLMMPVPDKDVPRCLTWDVGQSACSFSWAAASYDNQRDTVNIDEVGEVAPGDGEQIHHGLMWEHVIEKLVQGLRVIDATWDQWQSSRYIADLRTKYQVDANQYTLSPVDGKLFRSALRNGRVTFPKPEIPLTELPIGNNQALARVPRAHLLLQILTVRDSGNGLPIKPQGGNDDTFRAVLLAHTMIRAHQERYIFTGSRARPPAGLPMKYRNSPRTIILDPRGGAVAVGPRRF